jgi:hypothetical protein
MAEVQSKSKPCGASCGGSRPPLKSHRRPARVRMRAGLAAMARRPIRATLAAMLPQGTVEAKDCYDACHDLG